MSSDLASTLTSLHSNNYQTHSLLSNLASPANAIINPLNPTHGYGRLRHFNRMKREKFLRDAHPPLSVRWDEVDLSSIIDVLESCGNSGHRPHRHGFHANTAQPSTNKNKSGNPQQLERRFDPRAPHFDVILIDLTNTISDTAPDRANIPQAASLGHGASTSDPKDSIPEGDHSKYIPGKIAGNTPGSRAKPSSFRSGMDVLPMESLAGRPGWVFLWVGPTKCLVEGRRLLGSWGFRKVECIGWMKTDGGWDRVQDAEDSIVEEDFDRKTGSRAGVLRNVIQWCIMGCKGSAKRTFDSHLIHCNSNTDVMISDGPDAPISSLLSHIIENFSLGQRRLHLFAKPSDERPGWVTVGRDMRRTNFDCKRYLRTWGESGRQGWLTTPDPEIEYFRPKTPPLQVRRRERSNKYKKNNRIGGDNGGKGKFEAEPPKFPHLGQRKRAVWRPMNLTMQQVYALYPHMDKINTMFSVDEGATTFNFPASLPQAKRLSSLEREAMQKPLMDSRVSQLSGSAPNHHRQQQQQHQNRRSSAQKFQPSALARQFQPSASAQDTLPQKLAELTVHDTGLTPAQPRARSPHQPAPFAPQQMTLQPHQAEPLAKVFYPASDAPHGKPINQSYPTKTVSLPLSSPSVSSGLSVGTSLPSSGQSEHTSNDGGSLTSQSSTPIYTYIRPPYTPPEFIPGRYHNAPAALPVMENGDNGPVPTLNSGNNNYSAQQARFWAGQANMGDTGARNENRPLPSLPQGLNTLSLSSNGQTGYKPLLSPHPIPSYRPNQQQHGVFGAYGVMGPSMMDQARVPAHNHPLNSNNNGYTYGHNLRQNLSPNFMSYGRGAYSGQYAAPLPRQQDYVRGENGEFILDHHPQYQQQPYLGAGNGQFRVEQRQQKTAKQDPALPENQIQVQSQTIDQDSVKIPEAQNLGSIPAGTQGHH